jgi:hypothetical protein
MVPSPIPFASTLLFDVFADPVFFLQETTAQDPHPPTIPPQRLLAINTSAIAPSRPTNVPEDAHNNRPDANQRANATDAASTSKKRAIGSTADAASMSNSAASSSTGASSSQLHHPDRDEDLEANRKGSKRNRRRASAWGG